MRSPTIARCLDSARERGLRCFMLRRSLVAVAALLAAACGDDDGNPFAGRSLSRPPSASAALVFVSGSWAAQPGAPRELLALDAAGTSVERLTTCAENTSPPCDFVSVAPSPQRVRVAAIRTTPEAEEGATALYFMDLSRSVETILFSRRRIDSVDWSSDDSFLIYSALVPQTSQADLFFSQPNGQQEENLTESLAVSERNAGIDPFSRTAVYERDEAGVSRIYLFRDTPLTSGPATGGALPGTPYVVGSDADPVFSPDGTSIAFRRLTSTANSGLGTWDILTLRADGRSEPVTIASGPLFRGAPDWGSEGLLFVETDAAASRSELVVLQPDGSGRRILRTEDAGYRMGAPRWLATPR